jgi:hypothetical protein
VVIVVIAVKQGEKNMAKKDQVEIVLVDYETLSIKLPKEVVNFLRTVKLDKNDPSATIEDWVSWHIVDTCRSFIDGAEFPDWADAFGLSLIFKDVLGDTRIQT